MRNVKGSQSQFVIGQSPQTLRIKYVGKDAPDTLIARATAIVTGTLGRDGVFVADIILVKATSKKEHAELNTVSRASFPCFLQTPLS
jgi:cytochrome c-type biogenesis protein CcmE